MKLETKARKLKAKIPTQGTKTFKILEALNNGQRVSMLDNRKFNCTSITQRVGDLKRFGWPVRSE